MKEEEKIDLNELRRRIQEALDREPTEEEIERGKRLYKELSTLSHEDLHKRMTI